MVEALRLRYACRIRCSHRTTFATLSRVSAVLALIYVFTASQYDFVTLPDAIMTVKATKNQQDQCSIHSLRARIFSAMYSRGIYIREENGQLVEVSTKWATPLIQQMSKSMCIYVMLGLAGRKSHSVVLSRRQVNALQRFSRMADTK